MILRGTSGTAGSIVVDVRYVLWITGEVFGIKQLVQEMLSNNTATIAPGASLDKAPVIYPREVRLLALNSGTVPKYIRTMRQRRSLTVFRLFVPLATVAAGSDRLGTIDLVRLRWRLISRVRVLVWVMLPPSIQKW